MFHVWNVILLLLTVHDSLCAPDTCLGECNIIDDKDVDLGRALLNGGHSVVDRLEDYESNLPAWYSRVTPGIARVIDESRLSKLFPKLTNNLSSGELWESTENRLFRYWQLERALENETLIDFTNGWIDKSEIFDSFSEANRCRNLKGRYALVDPIIDKAIQQFLTRITGIKELKPTMFAGCNGTAASLHFDRSNNYFFQLRGLKRFILLPPSVITGLYVAPTGHPYTRQSLIEPATLSTSTIDYDKYPLAKQFWGKALIADLIPGDLLLIPKFWSHFVITKSDDSVGLALRMPYDYRVQKEISGFPLPFEWSWSYMTKIGMMKEFLKQLLPKDEIRQVFKKRWEFAFPNYHSSESNNQPETSAAGENIDSLTEYSKRGKDLADKVRRILSKANPHQDKVEMMQTVEYADDVVLTLFSPREAVEFVLDKFA